MTVKDLNEGTVNSSRLVCNILQELEELLALAAFDPEQLLEFLPRRDYSAGMTVKVVMEDRTIERVFLGYQSVDAAVVDLKDELVVVPATSVILVEYSD